MSSSPQLPLALVLEPEATFKLYLAGPNHAVVSALQAAATEAGASWPLLSGPAGSGKTHLLNAICHAASATDRRAMLLPAASCREFGPALLQQIDAVDVVAIDDVDQLVGQPEWDEALFHLFNQIRQQQATLVLASTTEPAALRPSLPDLGSRLGWGLTLKLEPLDEAARADLLKQRARSKGIDLSDDVLRYVLRRAPRDVSSLLNLLGQLEHASLVEKRRITVPFMRQQFPLLGTAPNKTSGKTNETRP